MPREQRRISDLSAVRVRGLGSSRSDLSKASLPGHNWRATRSDTIATAALCAPLGLGEAAPAHEIDAEHAEVLRRDELVRDAPTCQLAPSANAGRPPSPAGHEAATATTDGSLLHRFEDRRRASASFEDAHVDDVGRADAGVDRRGRPRAAQEDGRSR